MLKTTHYLSSTMPLERLASYSKNPCLLRNHIIPKEATTGAQKPWGCRLIGSWSPGNLNWIETWIWQLQSWELCIFSMAMDSWFIPWPMGMRLTAQFPNIFFVHRFWHWPWVKMFNWLSSVVSPPPQHDFGCIITSLKAFVHTVAYLGKCLWNGVCRLYHKYDILCTMDIVALIWLPFHSI